MLIAQITDVHVGFDQDDPDELNIQRLDRLLDHLLGLAAQPDLLLVTGDLTDKGDAQSYRRLAERLDRVPFPTYLVLGNHDTRDGFREVFPHAPDEAGFLQFAIEEHPLRLLVLDTLEEGRHGGAFCATRAEWLAAKLAEAPERPTLLVLHHPPIDNGIEWMTTHPDEPWVARLGGAIAGAGNVVGLICGHVHRPILGLWRGLPVAVCPSSAPAVALTLEPMDPDTPDGRPMVTTAPPGFALHLWKNGRLVTHFDSAEEHEVLASFGPNMQDFVRHLLEERPH